MSPTRQSSYNLKGGRSGNNTKRWALGPCYADDLINNAKQSENTQIGSRRRILLTRVKTNIWLQCLWISPGHLTISGGRPCFVNLRTCGALKLPTGAARTTVRAAMPAYRFGRRDIQEINQKPPASISLRTNLLWYHVRKTTWRSRQQKNISLMIAYRNDILLLIKENSRLAIETKVNDATNLLTTRCKRVKLQISAKKTTYALTKGIL